MGQAAYARRPDDDRDADDLPRASLPRPVVDVAPSPALTPVARRSARVASLQQGQPFGEGDQVGAIITNKGMLVVAMPGQFFDTTDHGRKIRLQERKVPGTTPRKIAEWWAGGEGGVGRIVGAAEFQQGDMERELPTLPPAGIDYRVPRPLSRTRRSTAWLPALVVLALLAAAGLTYLLETRSDPVMAAQLLPALIGLAGLVIFGLAAMAIMRGAVTS